MACTLRFAGRLRRTQGEADHELAPLALPGAGSGDAPVVHLDEAPHQGESDPESPLAAVERAVGLGEQVEDARQQLGRDADPVVAYPDHGGLSFATGLDRD